MSYESDAKAILIKFLDRLERKEQKEFLLLTQYWNTIQDEISSTIEKLAAKEFKSENQLYLLGQYKLFLRQSQEQISLYSQIASGVISDNQRTFGAAGIESTQEMISLEANFFNKLPVEVINNFIGKSFYDGSKLDDTLFAKSYPDYISQVKDTLLNSIALGKNPRETARLIRKECNAPLWQSLRLARTEQLTIFRETSLMQMKESGVVSEWEWIAEKDACDYCLGNNGKRFSLEIGMETHPNCRCGQLPIVE